MHPVSSTTRTTATMAALALLTWGCDGLFADLDQLSPPEAADAGDSDTDDADGPDSDDCDPDHEGDFGGGAGVENDPYLVCTVAHIGAIRGHLNDHFALAESVDFTGTGPWDPIGTAEQPFSGEFVGHGRSLINLEIQSEIDSSDPTGLFSATATDAVISDLVVEDPQIGGGFGVGAVVGHNHGTLEHITVEGGGEVRGIVGVGGIAGTNDEGGIISNGVNDLQIYGDNWVGGIAGINVGDIEVATNEGTLFASDELDREIIDELPADEREVFNTRLIGGIAGLNGGEILDSSGEGPVTARGELSLSDDGFVAAGGVAGLNVGLTKRCRGTRSVTARTEVDRNGHTVLFGAGGLTGGNAGVVEVSYSEGTAIHVDIGDVFEPGDDWGEELDAWAVGVGGLAGINSGRIADSYTTAGVTHEGAAAGGLVGILADYEGPGDEDFPSVTTRIIHSYAAGPVEPGFSSGGLVGHDDPEAEDSVVVSFFDTDETSHDNGILVAGDGLSSAEFGDEDNFPGWDFSSIWEMGSAPDGVWRPVLTWQ